MNIPSEPLPEGVWHIMPTLPVHVHQSGEPGPTAIIQGGIHGNEVAGVHAIEELLEAGVFPERGRILWIPRMNPPACRSLSRMAPAGLDLNRRFPGDPSSPQLEDRLAHALFQLVLVEQPALVATLHESDKRYHPDVHPSFGQTLVYGVTPCPPLFERVVARLNTRLHHEQERWATHHYPVETSSTEQIVAATGCLGTCVETWITLSLRRRVDMHKDVIRLLLDELNILPFHGATT